MGQGRVRLVRIGAGETPVDLQPCGGTHVKTTAEIGKVALGKIEKKGKAEPAGESFVHLSLALTAVMRASLLRAIETLYSFSAFAGAA